MRAAAVTTLTGFAATLVGLAWWFSIPVAVTVGGIAVTVFGILVDFEGDEE